MNLIIDFIVSILIIIIGCTIKQSKNVIFLQNQYVALPLVIPGYQIRKPAEQDCPGCYSTLSPYHRFLNKCIVLFSLNLIFTNLQYSTESAILLLNVLNIFGNNIDAGYSKYPKY